MGRRGVHSLRSKDVQRTAMWTTVSTVELVPRRTPSASHAGYGRRCARRTLAGVRNDLLAVWPPLDCAGEARAGGHAVSRMIAQINAENRCTDSPASRPCEMLKG